MQQRTPCAHLGNASAGRYAEQEGRECIAAAGRRACGEGGRRAEAYTLVVAEVRPQNLAADATYLDGVPARHLRDAAFNRVDRVEPVELREFDAKAVSGHADIRQKSLMVVDLLGLERAVVAVDGALVETVRERHLEIVVLEPREPEVGDRRSVEDVVVADNSFGGRVARRTGAPSCRADRCCRCADSRRCIERTADPPCRGCSPRAH